MLFWTVLPHILYHHEASKRMALNVCLSQQVGMFGYSSSTCRWKGKNSTKVLNTISMQWQCPDISQAWLKSVEAWSRSQRCSLVSDKNNPSLFVRCICTWINQFLKDSIFGRRLRVAGMMYQQCCLYYTLCRVVVVPLLSWLAYGRKVLLGVRFKLTGWVSQIKNEMCRN